MYCNNTTLNKIVGAATCGLLALTQLHAAWNVGYPWGRTHNGTAYMTHGGDTMRATQPGTNGYKYNSGASYNTTKLVCTSASTMGAQATCTVTTNQRGVWPAFWITSEGAWTSEVDIAEWKGSNTCWQNTYDGGWESLGTSSNGAVYKAHCWASPSSGASAVKVQLSINNTVKATHTGSNFLNKNFWLIRNLQMEGSSGSPGPASATYTCSNVTFW